MADVIQKMAGSLSLLEALTKSIADLNQKLSSNAVDALIKGSSLFIILKEQLGDAFNEALVMKILDKIVPSQMQISNAELTARGDVSTTQSIEAEGGVTIDFVPWVSFAASGAYSQRDAENWGVETRVQLAFLPVDKQVLADMIRLGQTREPPKPEQLGFLEQFLPVLKEVLMPTPE